MNQKLCDIPCAPPPLWPADGRECLPLFQDQSRSTLSSGICLHPTQRFLQIINFFFLCTLNLSSVRLLILPQYSSYSFLFTLTTSITLLHNKSHLIHLFLCSNRFKYYFLISLNSTHLIREFGSGVSKAKECHSNQVNTNVRSYSHGIPK